MRTATVLFTLFAAATLSLTACGGGGDDDGGDDDSAGGPDAMSTQTPDAEPAPDAVPANAGAHLGDICNQQTACAADTPDCVALAQNATNGMCTMFCGSTPNADARPTQGDAVCAANYTGTAFPVCALYDDTNPADVQWSCALACGMIGDTNYTCPANYTCSAQQLCIPN